VDIINQVIDNENKYALYNGDCVEVVSNLKDNSIDFSIFSPPFASLYTYSNSDRDMGNCGSDEEFFGQFSFLVEQLYRVLKPGRLIAIHCMNLTASKAREGYIGIRGDLIRKFQDYGFIYHMSRQGLPDYLLIMRKPGVNEKPISGEFTHFVGDELMNNFIEHERDDERHFFPLQLDVVESAMQLWSKPGDTVLTPFLGIGTEAYTAVKMGRKAIGVELKPSYFNLACRNLEQATKHQYDMFSE